MKKEDIKKFVEENPKLVTMRESTTYPGLFVLKYRRNVFFKGLWNDFLENCRGTVVDKEFNVISRPFQKIYNFRVEERSPVLSDDVEIQAFRKANGFMATLTWHNNDILISTTGSLDSDFIQYTKDMMLTHASWADWQMVLGNSECRGMSFMFEVVHPDDPHIIPEKPGMYVIGYRDNTWESTVGHSRAVLNIMASLFKCHSVEGYNTTVGELVALSKTVNHEGFVFYSYAGDAAKIKSPYYLVSKALARKKDILSLNKELVEEEYFDLVDYLNTIKDEFNAKSEQDRLEFIRQWFSKGN
jgi:hypothetical protein